jgi:hypothetical protein
MKASGGPKGRRGSRSLWTRISLAKMKWLVEGSRGFLKCPVERQNYILWLKLKSTFGFVC